MKILICSKLFYPSDQIGAVRPSNFAKYLAEFGHCVTVVTEKNNYDENFSMPGVKIIRVSNRTLVQKIIHENSERIKKNKEKIKNTYVFAGAKKSSDKNLKSKIQQPFIKSRSLIFYLVIEYDWYVSAKQLVKKCYKKNSFDVVISSYGPLSSFLLGKSISKLHIANYWNSDFRDNMVFNGYPRWLNKIFSNFEKAAVRCAHSITFVSQGQKAMFLNNNNITEEQKKKIHVVYNGYEKTILGKRLNKKDGKLLRFTYTGQLYDGVRDFTLFFNAISDLIEEKKINRNYIRIEYAGPSSKELTWQVKKFQNVKDIIFDYGVVSRDRSLELQNESDFLIALTWNTQKEKGILTGKFLEYLQAQKPIISLTAGDTAYGELTEMIEELYLGIACEYINYESDILKLKDYLLYQYNSFLYNDLVEFSPRLDRIYKFHYKSIVEEFEKILSNIF